MRGLILSTLAGLAAASALAQTRGAPDSPACREALSALETSEGRVAAARTPDSRRELSAAQRRAALACLGGTASADAAASAPPSRAGIALPPPGTPRIVIPPLPPLPAPPPAAARIAPPPAASPPLSVTACDAAGCWASDGSRLTRTGPNSYVGPSGLCTSSGALLQCNR